MCERASTYTVLILYQQVKLPFNKALFSRPFQRKSAVVRVAVDVADPAVNRVRSDTCGEKGLHFLHVFNAFKPHSVPILFRRREDVDS